MAGSRRSVVLAALALLGLWHLALRRHGLHLPRISDEGEYAYESRVLAQGGLPYRDAFNQKPPLVFFLYRASDLAFGSAKEGPRRLAIGFSWASMALLFFCIPAAWGLAARLSAAAAFGSLSTFPLGDLGFAANTEIFMAGFLTLCAWALIRHWEAPQSALWPLLAGAGAGAALSTKQTAVWATLAFAVSCVIPGPGAPTGSSRRRWRGDWSSLAWFLGGCLIVPGVLFVYFGARGGLGDLFDQVWRRNLDYASLVARSGAAAGQLAWLATAVAPAWLFGAWPACALAVWGLAGVQADARSPRELMIALWLAGAAIGMATGMFFFPHYLVPVLPPLALAAGLGVRRIEARTPKAGLLLILGICLMPAAARARIYFRDSAEVVARKLLYPNPLFESEAIADYIQEHSAPSDSIYVFGSEPQIYVAANRRCATSNTFVYPLTLFPDSAHRIFRELRDLSNAKPRFVVFMTSPASTLVASKLGEAFRAGVIAWLARDYRWSGTIELRPDGSRAAFWGDEGEPAKTRALPEWSAPDRIFLFERQSN